MSRCQVREVADMSKYIEIFDYMRQCPQLADLWSIAATEEVDVNVIFPQGTSTVAQYQEYFDVYGNYVCEIVPFPSVYEDYQINCYRWYDSKDNTAPKWNQNVLKLDEVQSICDWVKEQNDNGNLPKITGKQVVSIECNPFNPQIRYVNEQENTIGYFITIRIRYVNRQKRKSVEYGDTN